MSWEPFVKSGFHLFNIREPCRYECVFSADEDEYELRSISGEGECDEYFPNEYAIVDVCNENKCEGNRVVASKFSMRVIDLEAFQQNWHRICGNEGREPSEEILRASVSVFVQYPDSNDEVKRGSVLVECGVPEAAFSKLFNTDLAATTISIHFMGGFWTSNAALSSVDLDDALTVPSFADRSKTVFGWLEKIDIRQKMTG